MGFNDSYIGGIVVIDLSSQAIVIVQIEYFTMGENPDSYVQRNKLH